MVNSSLKSEGLLDNLKVGVYRCTPGIKGTFLFANPTLKKMLGYTTSEFQKKSVSSIFGNKKSCQLIDQSVSKNSYIQGRELQIRTKDKRLLWCSLTAVVVRDRKGKAKWIDGLLEDITARKQVERDLTESRELFRVVFENSAAAIIVTDKKDQVVACNPFAEKLLGTGKDDIFNKPVQSLYSQGQWQRLRSSLKRKNGMISNIETQIVKSDGALLPVSMSLSALKDIDGKTAGSIGILRDITAQKTAEKRIRDSESKIRVILDNSAAGITLLDDQGRIVSWNSFTEQMLGMTKKDLNLRPIRMLYPEREWQKLEVDKIYQKGSKHHLETKIIKNNGQVIDIDLAVNVVKDSEGRVIGSVGIMQDITEQKRVQHILLAAKLAAEQANNAKSLFLANMSHEVRTPINAIMGMIDLTLDMEMNQEQRDNLCTARDAADNLLNLLNNVLDLTRVESGKINLEMIELNVREVIESVCKGLSVLARNKNIGLVWDAASDVPETLFGDPVRLRQVLLNLANNAIKFTAQGQITLGAKVSSVLNEECQVLFSVADQGVGIPRDKQEKIFDTFTQADDSTTRRFGGTGLGLAICKKLVEMMGGRIWVESEDGKGSTFHFTTTFKTTPQGGIQFGHKMGECQAPRGILKKHSDQISILLAEDNIVNQRITQKLLEKRGWRVVTVENGQEVLEWLDKEDFDLILMDAHMPILDGLQTTQRIREQENEKNRHIPIIALTARAMDDDKSRCLAAGMDGYVSKPIDRFKLYEAVEGLFIEK